MANWLSYLMSPADGSTLEGSASPGDVFGGSRLIQYLMKYPNLTGRNQPSPFGPGGIYGPPQGGLLGGGTTTPPSGGGTPTPNPSARWSFPQYTQNWAFTPPTPAWYPDPPKFDKSKYPTTTTTKK